jgi:AcrR family transcriptional regulator
MPPRLDPRLPRDAEATKHRLLSVATAEFAEYGIAGARVDRISEVAKVNKSMIYAYFGGKDALFDAVLNAHVTRLLDTVQFTPEDLPGYAGLLFDYLLVNPHQLRLATWYRLERPVTGVPTVVRSSMQDKASALAEAQRAGTVPRTLAAEDLLVFLLGVVTAWLPSSPNAVPNVASDQLAEHRQAVVTAVSLLIHSGH